MGLHKELQGIREDLQELVVMLQEMRDMMDTQVVEGAQLRDEVTQHHSGWVLPPMQWDPEKEVYHWYAKLKGKKTGEDEEEMEDRSKGSSSRKTQEQQDEEE